MSKPEKEDRPVQRLRRGELPKMVDWYDPKLLAQIGLRTVISSTMGQYADQRLLQAASDQVHGKTRHDCEHDLAHRYDYSDIHNGTAAQRVEPDENGAVWFDYISDLGDGFEATHAMAHLLAPEYLDVEGAGKLKAGEVLVMGGDQAYPQATRKEYRERLLNPYDWAFQPDMPRRKLFAIPGNHDWYDGLTAFDSLFCSARDRISGGLGRAIGGWRCQQHRSYFAIKLPYDWWVWGADIQLDGYLDDPQRDYFDLISEHMGPKDKVIICLAEPSWLHKEYENLHEISMLARQSGAQIYAVLAGDLHHYSRFYSPDIGINFITCGGGGAFAHATHQINETLKLRWASVTRASRRIADPDDSAEFNELERRVLGAPGKADFTEKRLEMTGGDQGESMPGALPGVANLLQQEAAKPVRREKTQPKPKPADHYKCEPPVIYPSKRTSVLLSLKNIGFPFMHFKFSLALGFLYLIYFWIAAPYERERMLGSLYYLEKNAWPALSSGALPEYAWHIILYCFAIATVSLIFAFFILALWVGLMAYVDVSRLKSAAAKNAARLVIGSIHFLAHVLAIGTLAILITLVIRVTADQRVCGEVGCVQNIASIKSTSNFDQGTARLAKLDQERKEARTKHTLISPVLMLPIGGIVAGFIWGLYWVLCGLFRMHCDEAFGALACRHYKHFLRMRFEPDQLTIYPVRLDTVPGSRGWREPSAEQKKSPQNPQIMPREPLQPRLIEKPIVIKARNVV